MVVSRHKETTVLKLVVVHFTEFQNCSGVDDLWQIFQPDPVSEKQGQ